MDLSDIAPEDFEPSSADWWLDWFLGTPLRLLITLVVGLVVLVVLRRVIRTVTNHIADGTALGRPGLRELGGTEVGSAILRNNPLASARRAQRARTIGSVLRSGATLVVGAVVLLMMLSDVGVNIMPLLASAGVAGVALGFGAQSLVKDFLSGTFMLLEDQYGVGDVVTFGEVTGTVEAVALRVTKVRDISGTLWYLRNGEILSVGNQTQGWARAMVEVQLRPDADVEGARELLRSAGRRLTDDPVLSTYLQEEPEVIGIEALSAESMKFKVQVKTNPAMQWEVARALRVAVREELEGARVQMAIQQQTLVVSETGATSTDAAAAASTSGPVGGPGTPP
ncbi:mechanosensitive ion channel family protein [Sanguibacter suaedae]|uniref:Mechanosensitive ion channel family protein n=1 Tax=Sanguibacter suaedae TaxID=2795737 RepID=A0A934IDR3_9MICO|nr:mechanosensitive ion channel family protein [Sanguibacter suaedae]MBI9115059.1 mechanosensitive ion channel family protein [Sanguibacter suaedae]